MIAVMLRMAAAMLVGLGAALLVAGVLFAYGNAFFLWEEGWAVAAALVGAGCGVTIGSWILGVRPR